MHQLQCDVIGDAVADHDRHAHLTAEGLQIQGLLPFRADVFGAHHGGLHKEQIRTGLSDGRTEAQGCGRCGADGCNSSLFFDLGNAAPDQVLTHWLAVELLHQGHKLFFAHRGDAIKGRVGVLVSALNPFQVQYPHGSLLSQLNAHAHIDNAVHGAGDDRDFAADPTDGPAAIGYGRINGPSTGHQGDLINAVGPTNRAGAPQLNVHRQLIAYRRRKLTISLPFSRCSGLSPYQ